MIPALLLPLAVVAPQEVHVSWEEVRLEHGERQLEPIADPPSPAGAEESAPATVPASWLDEGEVLIAQLEHGYALVALVGSRKENHRAVLGGDPAAASPAWRHELRQHEVLTEDGARLLAAASPHQAHGGPGYLAQFDDAVLVHGGERGELMRVDPVSGRIHGRLHAAWELERGFVGPSVWSALPARFGEPDSFMGPQGDKARQEREDRAREAFEARCTGWLLGPPVVTGRTAFVVLARATPGSWARQRAGCALLEFDARGFNVKTLTDLPGPVHPGRAVPGGALFPLVDGGLLRVDAASSAVGMSMGPGGHERRAQLRWLQRPAPPTGAFLQADADGGSLALGSQSAVFQDTGAYVPLNNREELRIPIEVVGIEDGQPTRLELVLGLTAAATKPVTNYSYDGITYRLLGPRLALLSQLSLPGDGTLRFVVQAGGESRALAFPASALRR